MNTKKTMVYRELYFSSANADNNDMSDPIFSIPENIFVDRWRIESVTLPLSWNVVGDHNNTITVIEGGVPRTVGIPSGNYNVATLGPALQTALGGTYQVTFNETTRKYTISNNTAFQVAPGTMGTGIWRIIGMSKTLPTPSATSTVMPNVADLTNNAPVLLTSTSISSPHLTFAGRHTSNIIAVIPIDAPQGSYMTYQNMGSFLESSTSLSLIDFHILDSATLRPLQLNGCPFFVKLSVLTDQDDVV
jgi:hypothetical protein